MVGMLEYLSPRRRAQHTLARLDVFDLHLADRLTEAEIARQAVELAEEGYQPARRLFQDTLLGLYKNVPRQKPVEEVIPSHRLNHTVLGKAMRERAFQELRLRTRLDRTMALLGTLNLWERLMELLTEGRRRLPGRPPSRRSRPPATRRRPRRCWRWPPPQVRPAMSKRPPGMGNRPRSCCGRPGPPGNMPRP